MSKSRLLLIVFCVFVSTIPLPAIAQDSGRPDTVEYVVIADTANLRAGAGTSFSIVATVTKGGSLLIYDETPATPGWLRVFRSGEEDAYVADFLVERAPMRFYPSDQEPFVVLSGQGKNISDVLDIPRGAYRIDATIQDNSFILKSVIIEGDCDDDTIFNEVNFDVNRLVISGLFVSTGCSVIFQTDNVDGSWEIAFRDILDKEFLQSSTLAIENGTSITGTGRSLTMSTLLPEGVWTISATVEDDSFILAPQVLTGDCESTHIFNELNFDVSVLEVSAVYRSGDGGCIIFWETSNLDGNWEIKFEKIR
jgi:hypothetical protein